MKDERKKTFEGSYTIEAALLFSVLLLVLADILLLTEFQTDRVRMTALLEENTLILAGRQTDLGHPPDRSGFFRLSPEQAEEGKDAAWAWSSCSSAPENSRYGESYEETFRVRIRRPVTWIRRIRLLQALEQE